jgi:hypothetical protein
LTTSARWWPLRRQPDEASDSRLIGIEAGKLAPELDISVDESDQLLDVTAEAFGVSSSIALGVCQT